MNGVVRSAVQALLQVFDDQYPYDHGWVRVPARLDANVVKAISLLAEQGFVLELPNVNEELPLTRVEAHQVIQWLGDDLTEKEDALIRELEVATVRSGGEADFLKCVRSALSIDGHRGFPLFIVVLDAMTLDASRLRIVRLAVERVVDEIKGLDTTDRTVVLESSRSFASDHVVLGLPTANHPPTRRLSGQASNQGLRPISTHASVRSGMVEMAQAWKEKPLCFFLGAGFSLSSEGMPLGDDMRDHALRTMFPMSSDDSPRQLSEHLYRMLHERGFLLPVETQFTPDERSRRERFLDELTLERVMHANRQLHGALIGETLDWFEEQHLRAVAAPGVAVVQMRRLIERVTEVGRPLIVLTVNFDELLDPVFESQGHPILATSEEIQDCLPELVAECIESKCPATYVKLHGTISNRESLVVDMEATAGNPTMLAFQGAMEAISHAGGPVIYVGHSMRDLDIRPALATRGLRDLDEHWVSLDGPSAALQNDVFPTRAWWMRDRATQRIHNATADDWMSHFAHVVETLA